MSIYQFRRRRMSRRCRGSAGGVGSRAGRKSLMREDGLPRAVDVRAIRKRLGVHSRELRCGRPGKYREARGGDTDGSGAGDPAKAGESVIEGVEEAVTAAAPSMAEPPPVNVSG